MIKQSERSAADVISFTRIAIVSRESCAVVAYGNFQGVDLGKVSYGHRSVNGQKTRLFRLFAVLYGKGKGCGMREGMMNTRKDSVAVVMRAAV